MSMANPKYSHAMHAFPPYGAVRVGPVIATARIATISPTFCGTWTFTPDSRASMRGLHRANQLIPTDLELQIALRLACLHERREPATGLDPEEAHCPRASVGAFRRSLPSQDAHQKFLHFGEPIGLQALSDLGISIGNSLIPRSEDERDLAG